MKRLENKTALVTGANSGIGYATAKELIEQGASVIITGRNKSAVEKAANEIGAIGIVADQSSLKAIDTLVKEVESKFGKLDILFLNAGIAEFFPAALVSEEHYDNVMNINLKGTFFTVQKLLSLINDGGSIIFNSSANATLGMPNTIIYSATKAAILSFTKVLAVELSSRKIRVNAISPGPIPTPAFDKLGMSKEQMEGFTQVISQSVLLGRFGTSEEIAKTVLFLSSDDSGYINGAEIKIDGGITINTVVGK
jgi:NAD(P)-dependent dehydrogenase (short-subunit alcohol dehydrogenase family)